MNKYNVRLYSMKEGSSKVVSSKLLEFFTSEFSFDYDKNTYYLLGIITIA